jgi:hypothetical protein
MAGQGLQQRHGGGGQRNAVFAVHFHALGRDNLRIPTHPAGRSDNIRSAIPGYPAT